MSCLASSARFLQRDAITRPLAAGRGLRRGCGISNLVAYCRLHDGRMAAHMGMFEVKGQVYGFMGSSPAVDSDPKAEPVSMT